MKKIIILIPSPLSFKKFLLDVYEPITKENIEVNVICAKYDDSQLYSPAIKYHFIDFDRSLSFRRTYRARYQLIKLVREIDADLIHAHFSSSAFLLAISKTKFFPKCVATIQGSIFLATSNFLKRSLYKLVEVFSAKRMDHFFVLTDDDFVAFRSVVKKTSLQKSKGFGVNLNEFSCDYTPVFSRKDIGLNDDDFVLIFIGRLVKFKGFNLVLQIINKLNTVHSNRYKLIVCGAFDKNHSNELNGYEKSIWENNKNIIKVGFTDHVKSYLKLADLNIFPSEREGLPVNIMESIAMGIPTITSNYRGCRHVIIPDVNGIIIEKQDITVYIKEVVNFFSTPEYRKSLQNGCVATRFLYDREFYQRELIKFYKSIF